MPDLKIGLIGLDTSHVVAFCKCFNKGGDDEHVPGGRITHAFAGVSPDFELSHSRVEKFTQQVRDDFDVKILPTPQAVAEAVDLVFITAVDGRQHLDYVRQTIPLRRPTFIDKPMAVSSADAREMFSLAEQHRAAMMSCSSLRYAQSLERALADEEHGRIIGCDVFGPMPLQPQLPGLFWYGIHSIEMLNRVMGRGCKEVRATTSQQQDVISAAWGDGRIASFHGVRDAHHKFGVTIHRERGFQFVDATSGRRSWYGSMLDAIMRSLPNGKSDIEPAETIEIVRMIECANSSRESGDSIKL